MPVPIDGTIERRHSDVELALVRDADVEAIKSLYHSIRDLRDRLRINVAQATLLANRISVAFSTLLRMPSAKPSPQMVAVAQSIQFLLQHLADEAKSWSFLQLHFTGRNIFTSMRHRLAKVWSLLPTSAWESEDTAAADLDDKENFALLAERAKRGDAGVPYHIVELLHDERSAVAAFRRRSSM